MVTIAVDAMGGDNAPRIEVEGAVAAAREFGVSIVLAGREEAVRAELARHAGWRSLPLQVAHAGEVVTMEDSAAKAVRSKRDSSMRVASRLVRDGRAAGMVSAGNTGAVMATAKMVQGMLAGVERPALGAPLPTIAGKPTVVLDVGANVDSTPKMLAQFALMGSIYSHAVFRVAKPRVGLLSIGEEDHKGNELTRAAAPLIRELPVDFIGNVEGRDIYTGAADVVVCDGFTGNVLLKVSESVADLLRQMLKESFTARPSGKLGAWIARGAFRDFRKRADYSEYGGAPLLGVRGVCIISHGSSNANAIKNAVRVAAEYAGANLDAAIEQHSARWTSSRVAARGD
jgi:glycerol-3-phosphate acyltransferase PlsX